MLPLVVAKENFGERPVPGSGSSRSRTRCAPLLDSLPERTQIDTPVSEQLIVEFYSK